MPTFDLIREDAASARPYRVRLLLACTGLVVATVAIMFAPLLLLSRSRSLDLFQERLSAATQGASVAIPADSARQLLADTSAVVPYIVARQTLRQFDWRRGDTLSKRVGESFALVGFKRAGEHGRGFAVVAEEVRRFSNATDAALERIRKLSAEIEAVSRRTADGMRDVDARVATGIGVVEGASHALERIVASIDSTRDATHTFADHALRQEEHASIVATHVASIAAAASDNAGSAEQVSALAASQRIVASTLHESTLRLASVANQLGSSLDGFTA